jgi:hypothetical protein
MMVTGDKWELYIPSELAYGDRGSPPKIGGGEVLIFQMEILSSTYFQFVLLCGVCVCSTVFSDGALCVGIARLVGFGYPPVDFLIFVVLRVPVGLAFWCY